jgi:ElaB/YqjD/DUF883 family membrane-anchored ribosome-binding protein
MDNVNNPVITRQQLVADFNSVLSDVEALIRATANQRGAEISKVRTQAADSVAVMKARVTDAEVALRSKVRQASKVADDYIRENPWRNLGVAAGAGLLIGLLIGRR